MNESIEDLLVRLAQNDYMIDGHYLSDGRALLLAASKVKQLLDLTCILACCTTSDESLGDGADMSDIDASNTMAMDALIVRARSALEG